MICIFTLNSNTKTKRFLLTLLTAIAGGSIFHVLHIPIPWLLGPMSAILLVSRILKVSFYWPLKIRDTGLLIFGYSMGLSFTKDGLMNILFQLPIMLIFNIITIMICALLAYFVSKLSGIHYPTVLTGSIPGGLTQMVYFAEETKGIDVSIVTFLQVVRLLVIIFVIPLLVFSPLFGAEHNDTTSGMVEIASFNMNNAFPEIFIFGVSAYLFALLGKKIKAPTPFLLGPIIATTVLNLSGLHGPELPASMIDASQLMISVYIGLLMNPEKIRQNRNIWWLSLLSSFILVGSTLILSTILLYLYPISSVTSFLSLAPGGMDQMGIIAHEVNGNMPFVAGFQLFRLLFIYFAVPPLLKWLFQKKLKSIK